MGGEEGKNYIQADMRAGTKKTDDIGGADYARCLGFQDSWPFRGRFVTSAYVSRSRSRFMRP
jgi:hypothetical protein